MVKITNGLRTIEVTRGAYESVYKHQGYTPVKEAQEAKTQAPANQGEPEKTDDELFLEEIAEKPLSQWNKDEVKRFAALKGIDISGTKNVNEAKDRIKEAQEAESQE